MNQIQLNHMVEKQNDDEIDLIRWIYVLWQRRVLIIVITVLAAIASIVIAMTAASTWRSEVKLMLPVESGSAGLLSSLGGIGALLGAGGGSGNANFYVNIINSRRMALHLIDHFQMYRNPGGTDPIEFETLVNNVRESLETDARESGFLTVSVIAARPELARDIVSEVVSKTNELINSLNVIKARERRIFLENRIRDLEAEYRREVEKLRVFYSDNRIFSLETQARDTVSATSNLLDKIHDSELQILIQEKNIGSEHPDILAAKQKLHRYQEMYKKIIAARSPDALQDMVPLLPLTELPRLQLTVQEIIKEIDVLKQVTKTLQEQYELSRIEEKKEEMYLRILDDPTLPVYRYSPRRKNIVIICTLAGLLFGIVLAFLLELMVWIRLELSIRNSSKQV